MGLQLLAQAGDVDINGPRRRHGVVAPDLGQRLVARHEFAAALSEVAQQPVFLGREVDRPDPRRVDLGSRRVQREVADADDAARGRRRATSPKQCLDPREQLRHRERLGEVIVGAELEANDLVRRLTSGGEHEDGRGDASRAEIAAHVEAAGAGQHDVQQDGIERAARGEREPRRAIVGVLHGVAFGL